MKYTFQHYMDISTSANSMQVVTVRAGGKYILQRCKHLFNTYKYFKLGGMKIKLLPASTLPVDPLGLGYGATDPQTVDPRDQMNPGLVRITNGENIWHSFASLSDEQAEGIYTNTMLDPRWSKFMLQSGFSRYAVPLFWDVGMNAQIQYPDAIQNIPITHYTNGSYAVSGESQIHWAKDSVSGNVYGTNINGGQNDDVHYGYMMQLGHRKKCGWLPTDCYEFHQYAEEKKEVTDEELKDGVEPTEESDDWTYHMIAETGISRIPSTDLITIVLPKAYKTIYYYRLFITETVYFKGIKNVGINIFDTASQHYQEYRAVDNFTFCEAPDPTNPTAGLERNLPYKYHH